MHAEAYQYVAVVAAALNLDGARVLEIGSYHVNGTVRPIFAAAATYHGIDRRPGPGVDEVIDAADFDGAGRYDVVVCCETLEHAPHPPALLATAWHALRPGGRLILTAAAPERAPHSCDGTPGIPRGETYTAIDPDDLASWLAAWRQVRIAHHPDRGDVYATATRPRGRA